MQWERMLKEAAVAILCYYPSICPEGLGKTVCVQYEIKIILYKCNY